MTLRAMQSCKLLLVLLAAGGLLACTMAPRLPEYPPYRFTDAPPLRLEVAEVELVQAYVPPLGGDNVEHLFPIPPAEAAAQWAEDRLAAVGRAGRARFIVEQAGVVEEPLPTAAGLRGMITRQEEKRYTAQLTVRLEVETAGGLGTGAVSASARRSRTVLEDTTLVQREQVFYELTGALIRELDAVLVPQIRSRLAPFLATP